jgi:hypothetical protein
MPVTSVDVEHVVQVQNDRLGYASMEEQSISSPTTISCVNQNQWYPWITASAGVLGGGITFTSDAAGDYLTIPNAGDYRININTSFSGSASATFEVAVVIDGAPSSHAVLVRKLGTGGDVGAAAIVDILTLTAGQELRVDVRCTSAAAKNFDIQVMHMTVVGVGV